MIFSPRQYRRLKSRTRIRYQAKWRGLLNALKSAPTGELKTWIRSSQSTLSEYTNFHWFFIKQLETFYFLQLTRTASGSEDHFGRDEEKVFDVWNNSEFADVFLKFLNKGKSVGEASRLTLKQFEQHLLILGKRHTDKVDVRSKFYRHQVALGERLRKGKISPLLSTTLHLEGKDLDLMTASIREMNLYSHRIELAGKLIRRFSPGSWERFVAFTDTIIPITDKEFVSYSHQDFPCVSMINLYDRDFVDMMDDLLHENGHHHLNHYLNLEKLIDEPAEMIYYSPWRRTLRPLRGIYHAYFTFFWGLRLFSDLASSDLDNIWYEFSAKEKEKIYWRAVEEYHMLNYSFDDLTWAKKQGLISKTGWEIMSSQQRELKKLKARIPQWEKKVGSYKKELSKLKKELRDSKKKYKKT